MKLFVAEFFHIFCMHHHTLSRHNKKKLKSGRDAMGKQEKKLL